MGLLDNIGSDPMMALGMGLLRSGSSSSRPIGLGEGLANGYEGMQSQIQANEQRKLMAQKLKMQELEQARMEQAQADQLKQREFLANVGQYTQSPAQQVLANGQGPTPQNAAAMQNLKPEFDRAAMYRGMMGVPGFEAQGLSGFASMDEKEMAREARKQELLMRHQDMIEKRKDDAQNRLDMLKMQQDGRVDIARMTGGFAAAGRSDAQQARADAVALKAQEKADEKAKAKAEGAQGVDSTLGVLRDAYDRLEKGGGITSTNKGPLDNSLAALSRSTIGQATGSILGTKNQSARNDIAMSRPALLAAMMKATGMSAKQMDSNAELKLWLATATDPDKDVESNRRALDNIERRYLNGAAPKTPGASGGWSDL